MKNKLKYKDFIGTVQYSSEDETFYGRIEGINDLVTFEGATVQDLKGAFEEAVEDYVVICNKSGKPVYKSFKGSFNVRLTPELHSKAYQNAMAEGKTLNQFVKEAIQEKLNEVT